MDQTNQSHVVVNLPLGIFFFFFFFTIKYRYTKAFTIRYMEVLQLLFVVNYDIWLKLGCEILLAHICPQIMFWGVELELQLNRWDWERKKRENTKKKTHIIVENARRSSLRWNPTWSISFKNTSIKLGMDVLQIEHHSCNTNTTGVWYLYYSMACWKIWMKSLISNFQSDLFDWWPKHHLRNCPQMNDFGPYWIMIISQHDRFSTNGLVSNVWWADGFSWTLSIIFAAPVCW